MNNRILTVSALVVAVVALSVAVAVRSVKRAEAARYAAERAASEEEITSRLSRKAEAEQKTAEALAKAEASKALAVSNEMVRARAAEKAKTLEAAAAARDADAAASDAAAAKDRAKALADEAAKAKAEAAKAASEAAKAAAEAAKVKAKAAAEADRLEAEKVKLQAFAEEAKVLELRKTDFETAERQLYEFRQELEERERALLPEKTTADLVWVGEREADVIGATGGVRLIARTRVRPEDDPSLPVSTRRLAKCDRQISEGMTDVETVSSNAVVRALERLYEQARNERRIVDADFYARSIRLLYPRWSYKPTEKEGVRP